MLEIVWILNTIICTALCQCDKPLIVNDWFGQIQSPGYPEYASGLDCKWIIAVSNGNLISAEFRDFGMSLYPNAKRDSDCKDVTDWVIVRDGNTTESPLIDKLCAWKIAKKILSSKNYIFIHMKTQARHRGFRLDYQGICTLKMKFYEGIIESPQYPKNYPSSSMCEWTIDFGFGFNTRLYFTKFYLEKSNCSYDYVAIFTGPNSSYPMLGKQYCELAPPPLTVLGPMTIVFRSDHDTELEGFQALYSASDVNECNFDNNCHAFAFCTNTFGSYTCTCKLSFEGDGISCAWYRDFNECLEGKNNCHHNANCIDTKDDYECLCKSGFSGDGVKCSDVDECSENLHNCHTNATCTNTIGSFKCSCIEEYEGDGINCEDRDECQMELDICHIDANCLNTDGSYSCMCKTGYLGDGINCHDVNECKTSSHGCDANADCTNTRGSYKCFCRKGYKGDGFTCTDVNECVQDSFHNCHKDADCINSVGSFHCTCKNGFEGNGVTCKDINECALDLDNCHRDATCSNINGSFLCLCNYGFDGNGTYCKDINECFLGTHHCHKDALCSNNKGSYQCSCLDGFYGDGINCQDINECAVQTDNCHTDATCNNTIGSFLCNCKHGFEGNGTYCKDLNECLQEKHNCHMDASCLNLKGSFECSCNDGYIGNGIHCQDIDECFNNSCHKDAVCKNTLGSFQCKCHAGYDGDGHFCEDINECEIGKNNCHENAYCENKQGGFSCTCWNGYKGNGTHCYDLNECALDHKCSENAYCTNTKGSYNCTCGIGYIGDGTICKDDDECLYKSIYCHSESICTNSIGSYKCECKNGFQGNGVVCQDINECVDQHNCHKDAICSNTYGSFRCMCREGLFGNGTFCQDVLECSTYNKCHSDAICMEQYASYSCICKTGYEGNGQSCADVNECAIKDLNICSKHATCINTHGSFQCKCVDGFIGDGFVCVDVNECEEGEDNCHSMANCINTIGSFQCNCASGFHGDGFKCEDTDECILDKNICDKEKGFCINTNGSYACGCKEGTVGDGVYCRDLLSMYLIIVSILNLDWNVNLYDKSSLKFNKTSDYIQQQVAEVYKSDLNYMTSRVHRLKYGSIRASIIVEFISDGKNSIDKLETASKRGMIGHLKIDPSSIKLNKLGACNPDCSANGYCVNSTDIKHSCVCHEGFEGNGYICLDSNECLILNGGCQQECNNHVGGYSCSCNKGFILKSDQKSCQVNTNLYNITSYCKKSFEQGISWPETVGGQTILDYCPKDCNHGYAARICNEDGSWNQPDLSQCVKKSLSQIHQRMKVMFNTEKNTTVFWVITNTIMVSLLKETIPEVNVLYGGDILEIRKILSAISLKAAIHLEAAIQLKEKSLMDLNTFLNGINSIVSNILDIRNHYVWHGLPQSIKVLNEYLSELDDLAGVLSKIMIDMMKKLSIKEPEFIDKLQLYSQSSELEIFIQIVETKKFNASHVMNSFGSIKNFVKYPENLFQNDIKSQIKKQGSFRDIGCWADYSHDSSILKLEAKHDSLKDSFMNRVNAIEKCAIVANNFQYNVFAIQDGGMCLSGPHFHLTYSKDGLATNCVDGKGGRLANSVYELRKFYSGLLTISHRSLGKLLMELTSKDDPLIASSTTEVEISQVVVSTSVLSNQHVKTVTPISIRFINKKFATDKAYCVQHLIENGISYWSRDNCVSYYIENEIICNCTVLALQTIIYNFTIKKSDSFKSVSYYEVLSYVSFGLNCLCLVTTLLIFVKFRLAKIVLFFQLNLVTVLILTEALFIFGLSNELHFVGNKWCKAETVLFHILLTSLFSWLLAQSWYTYVHLAYCTKKSSKNRLITSALIGYGFPFFVSLFGLAVFYDNYGLNTNVCWISNTLLFSLFIPPISLLVIINIVFLGMIAGVYFSHRLPAFFSQDKSITTIVDDDETFHIRDSIYGSVILLPVVIITWMLACLRMTQDSLYIKYAFLFFNTLLGMVYLISYCIFNREIMKSDKLWGYSTDYVDSPPTSAIRPMRAHKLTSHNNHGLELSPRLTKAIAYDGKNIISQNKGCIPNEVYEVQKQWCTTEAD
ncbi:uncharacterized protein LOC100197784 isoform X3 [Hydra vulgaris]|uniref:Uncharacterized protein LOC100197784 isoform X3 n=1 Tax=Hydra vulgaris TaxID=6087 RepID=A0ABM4D0X5_HYDVU